MDWIDTELLEFDENQIAPDEAPTDRNLQDPSVDPMSLARRSLVDALHVMGASDSGVISLTVEQLGELREIVERAVDGLALYLGKLDDEAESFEPMIERLQSRQAAFASKALRVRMRLLNAMHLEKFDLLPGKTFAAVLNFGESVELNVTGDPDEGDKAVYPDFVREKTTRGWAISEIKKALKAGAPAAATLARIVREPTSVSFDTAKVANGRKKTARRAST